LLRTWRLPDPAGEGSKETRGRVLIVAGAVEMPGAAILASTAALRAGAGKVRVAIAEAAALAVAAAVPELFVLGLRDDESRDADLQAVIDSARNTNAVLIGPGMRDVAAIESLLPRLLEMENLRALVIDATALPIAAKLLGKHSSCTPVVLTPHAAELAMMMNASVDQIVADPFRSARVAAEKLGCVVASKGAETFICAPDGTAFRNDRGNVGLATAGSGDVLAGIVAGLCARGTEPLQAAAWAVALHARAGERLAKRVGPVGYLAREIPGELPQLLAALSAKKHG
jgi:hydroxyethylthiazole kinase-like uncharacterized protein yjeF